MATFVFTVCRLVSRRCHMISPVVQVANRPLSEPDKRLLPSGSSVGHSASLRSPKGIQVGADLHAGPGDLTQDVVVLVPVVRLTPALAVAPPAQNARGVIDVARATACIVREAPGSGCNLCLFRALFWVVVRPLELEMNLTVILTVPARHRPRPAF